MSKEKTMKIKAWVFPCDKEIFYWVRDTENQLSFLSVYDLYKTKKGAMNDLIGCECGGGCTAERVTITVERG